MAMQDISIRDVPLSEYVMGLPLVRQNGNEYIRSVNKSDGFTIGERLEIAKEDNGKNSSCIRMASNWLAASAHKYLVKLGHDKPFDLFRLAHIL